VKGKAQGPAIPSLLPRYELLLAAASGGLDSMCLLDFLYENG